jgi:hypothetical protein
VRASIDRVVAAYDELLSAKGILQPQ